MRKPDEPERLEHPTPGSLIDHLLACYHARHREQLPELIRLASRVEQVHGHHLQCPNGLADLLRDIQQELENHAQGGTGAVPDAAAWAWARRRPCRSR